MSVEAIKKLYDYGRLVDNGTTNGWVWEKWIMPDGTKKWKGTHESTVTVPVITAGGEVNITTSAQSDLPQGFTVTRYTMTASDVVHASRILTRALSMYYATITVVNRGASSMGDMVFKIIAEGTWT